MRRRDAPSASTAKDEAIHSPERSEPAWCGEDVAKEHPEGSAESAGKANVKATRLIPRR